MKSSGVTVQMRPLQQYFHIIMVVLQSTPDNSNLQGKSKKGSSNREFEENSEE